MKKSRDKIDMLIEKNAAGQLSQFNWEQLNTAISSRLDKARQKAAFSIDFPSVLKVAATVAAAAIILITLTLNVEKLTDTTFNNGRPAEVRFIESKGSATVQLLTALTNSQVSVDIGPDRALAKCDVEIMDSNASLKENTTQAAWIIISRPQRVYADNGTNRDMMDVMYLF